MTKKWITEFDYLLYFYPKPANYTLNIAYSTFNYLYTLLGNNLQEA